MKILIKMEFASETHDLTELDSLKRELHVERNRRIQLEIECDLLAAENVRLQKICSDSGLLTKTPPKALVKCQLVDWDDIFKEGDGLYVNEVITKIVEACGGQNLTSVAFYRTESTSNNMAVVGGTDKTVRGYDLTLKRQVFELHFSAPIVSIDVWNNYIACSMMDGSHVVFRANEPSAESVTLFKDHSKYVTRIVWCPNGSYLATASMDKSVILYSASEGNFNRKCTLRFAVTPEAIVFAPSSKDTRAAMTSSQSAASLQSSETNLFCSPLFMPTKTSDQTATDVDVEVEVADGSLADDVSWDLIVGLRDTHYLLYVNCSTLDQDKVSLNERDWDTHVSFTPLYLALSPSRKYLLVATDKDLHLLLLLGTSIRIKTFSEHKCGNYGRPIVSWDTTDKYFYSNNESDFDVHVYEVCSGKIIQSIHGHRGAVRALAVNSNRELASVSFDHSLIVYGKV